jgi:predicted DNA-binding transcriptional regulator AlpA
MGAWEIAERLGVTKSRADQIVREQGFPSGKKLHMGKVWSTGDVETWIRRHRPQNVRTDEPS